MQESHFREIRGKLVSHQGDEILFLYDVDTASLKKIRPPSADQSAGNIRTNNHMGRFYRVPVYQKGCLESR